MAEKKTKPAKAPAPSASAPPAEESAKGPLALKGGKLKILLIAIAAMAVGGALAVAATRFLGGPAPAGPAEVGDELASASEAHAETEAPEAPIVAPTKGEGAAAGSGAHAAGGEGEAAAAAAADGPRTVNLKSFTTNLNEPTGRRFLKVTLGMEVDNQAAEDELNQLMPDIQDNILMLLSSQSAEDVMSVDGKERLKSQILNRTNALMTKSKVRKVKYSEFIVQ
ncbi:MAG: flagellar basal body-associated FliL family protein [Deltaproteobacteria bacterium]|jgi:flagellar FliL protein|nr:flagellar basal body-associated FliL family protein [Deltaproteobacteria bacterium]